MWLFEIPAFLVVYALVQAALFLFLIRSLDLYEREPIGVIVLMVLWGGIGACILALLGNDLVDSQLSSRVGSVFGASISAPPVEEIAKGVALLAAFGASLWLNKRFGFLEFEGVTDGIVYGAAIGIGFAFTEDIFYMINNLLEGPDEATRLARGKDVFYLRRDFLGLNSLGHAVMTAMFGAGLGLATWARSNRERILWPALGLVVAMLMHATHNGFAELVVVAEYGWDTTADWFTVGVDSSLAAQMDETYDDAYSVLQWINYLFLAVLLAVLVLWVRFQQRVIRYELTEETQLGTLDAAELETLVDVRGRTRLYWQLIRDGRFEQYRLVRRRHGELADLAFLKWRVRRLNADAELVARRRQRIAVLRAQEASAVEWVEQHRWPRLTLGRRKIADGGTQ